MCVLHTHSAHTSHRSTAQRSAYTDININGISTCFYSFYMQNTIIERHKDRLAVRCCCRCVSICEQQHRRKLVLCIRLEWTAEKKKKNWKTASWSSSVVVRIRRMEQNQLHTFLCIQNCTDTFPLTHSHRTPATFKQFTMNAYGSHSQIPIQARQICHIRWLIICSSRRHHHRRLCSCRAPTFPSTYPFVIEFAKYILCIGRRMRERAATWYVCVSMCMCTPAIPRRLRREYCK